MKDFELAMKNFLCAFKANTRGMPALSERYYKSILASAYFKHRAPAYFRVQVLYNCAKTKLNLKKYEEAKTFANMAITENISLENFFKEYSGIELYYYFKIPEPTPTRISAPHEVLGDIYLKLSEFKLAENAYRDALRINSDNMNASHKLQFIKFLTEKKEPDKNVNTQTLLNTLVQKSPWMGDWSWSDGSFGTNKMNFTASSNNTLMGKVFDISSGITPGNVIYVVLQNNCFGFILSATNTQYYYCLTEEETLEGTIVRRDRKGTIKSHSIK